MTASKQERKDAVAAAVSVARDLGSGQIDPAELQDHALDLARQVMSIVIGPDDPAWPLQVDITRQVLAAGGVGVNELAEWLAVAKSREPETPVPGGSWIERTLAEGGNDDDE